MREDFEIFLRTMVEKLESSDGLIYWVDLIIFLIVALGVFFLFYRPIQYSLLVLYS